MPINELIFLVQSCTISLTALGALYLGKEALVSFVCLSCILANFFILKQTTLFGLSATCTDAFTIGATLGLNLLQEYYGQAITRKTVYINFFLLIFYTVMSQIQLLYIPSMSDNAHTAFSSLLTFMPRIVVASFTVYFIAQMIDYYVYGLLKRTLINRLLIIRNYGSMAISQLVDTILFSFLGLYGIVDNIGEIIIISYCIKLVAIALTAPFVSLSRRIGVDQFDRAANS